MVFVAGAGYASPGFSTRTTLVDLAGGTPRSMDDEAEWLDDAHVPYALPAASQGTAATNVWEVPADGSGSPAGS